METVAGFAGGLLRELKSALSYDKCRFYTREQVENLGFRLFRYFF